MKKMNGMNGLNGMNGVHAPALPLEVMPADLQPPKPQKPKITKRRYALEVEPNREERESQKKLGTGNNTKLFYATNMGHAKRIAEQNWGTRFKNLRQTGHVEVDENGRQQIVDTEVDAKVEVDRAPARETRK